MGRYFFHVMGALAKMERELIVERTRAGLAAAARDKGRIGGRRRLMTPDVIGRAERMLVNDATLQQIALVLEVSVKTLYRYIPADRQHQIINSVC